MLTRPALLVSMASMLTLNLASPALAALKTERVEYKDAAGTILEGVVVFDDATAAKRPAVVLVHDWMGISAETEARALDVARMGYVVFAADIYGKGVRPKDAKEAGALAGTFKKDRMLLRARAQAALDAVARHPRVESTKLAAIGFCFGGTTAIELAKSGAALSAVVSFHGGLDAPTPGDSKNIKAKVLVLHGADDPFVSPADLAAFKADMRDAKVDLTFTEYAGTVHSFTNPKAGADPSRGAAYNERSSKRAFAAMKVFFDEVLK